MVPYYQSSSEASIARRRIVRRCSDVTDQQISRRRLLGATAATAAFTIVPRHVLGGAQHTAPSEKLNIAGIGVGGMGKSNLSQLETENIVALCDVDHAYAAGTFKKYPQAKVYSDYREMLDKEKGIDAVMIAHARPHARGHLDGGDAAGQARLLPEASDPRCLRGPHAGEGRPRNRRDDADGNPGPFRWKAAG